MLVLTRRVGEEIVIDGSIRIRITGIRGDRARIGITAPDFVRIDRDEVHHRRMEAVQASDEELAQVHAAR